MNKLQATLKQADRLPANVWKFYLYKLLWGLGMGLAIPVLVLYYLDRGVSLLGFMILMTILNLSTFIFEVPTGVVADKFSRKWSVCSGSALMVVSVVMMLTTTNYGLLALGFLCWGIGQSLVSGADSALLFDSLQAAGKEGRFQTIIGNAISLGLAMTVFGTIAGGLLIKWGGLSTPMWTWLSLGVAVAIIAATFEEPPMLKAARDQNRGVTMRAQIADYVAHLRTSFGFVSRNRALLALILMSMVLMRLWATTERPFAQPHLTTFGYNPEQISYLHTLFYLIAAILAKNSKRITAWFGDKEGGAMLAIGFVGSVAVLLMVNAGSGVVAVIGLSCIYVVHGLSQPLIQNSLNQRVTSEQRASCLSIANMGNSLLGVFLGPLFGYLADAWSLQTSLLIYQWTFIPLLLAGVFLCWKILGPVTKSTLVPASGS
jgi:MFS family permease